MEHTGLQSQQLHPAEATPDTGNPRVRKVVIGVVFLLNLLLVSPSLMPEFAYINPHDEAKYIDSGWRLTRGELRDLAWGPLVAFVYAPAHLIVGDLPDWFLIEAWYGRLVLFSALWLSTFYLASRLVNSAHPYVVAGTLLVSVPFLSVPVNQSDALFASLSALALAKLISFHKRHRLGDVFAGSALVGLCALTRAEAILLVPLFVALSLAVNRRACSLAKLAMAAILPAAAIFAAYLLFYRITSGGLDLGMGAKAYESFEWNQSILTGGDLDLAREEARRLFGTYEENRGSVLRAILRNPPAFGLRIIANARTLPDQFLAVFNKKLGPITLLLAAWGVYALLRRREAALVTIVLLWSLEAMVSLGFLASHIVPQTSFIPLAFAAVGATHIFRSRAAPWERHAVALSALALAAFGWLDAKPAFLAAGLITGAAMAIGMLLWSQTSAFGDPAPIPLLVLFAGMLILRGPYPFPNYPALGKSPQEQAVHLMSEKMPPGSPVLAPLPLPPLAARMHPYAFSDVPGDLRTSEELITWLRSQGIRAIYLDSAAGQYPEPLRLIEASLDGNLRLGYSSQDGRIRLILVEP